MTPNSLRVLVVEDNPGDADLVDERLGEAGGLRFETTHELTLAGAVRRLAAERFDLVLLDLGLPDSRGRDTLARIRQAGPQVPIVVLTELDDEEVGIEAVGIGAQDYLVKNKVNANLLVRTIRYAVERARVGEALRASEERSRSLATIVELSEDAIIGKTGEGTILTWNRGAERMYGYTAGEAVGKNISLILPPGAVSDHESVMDELRQGKVIQAYETVRRKKDGTEFPVSLSMSPLSDLQGKITGFASIGRDISRLKETERTLQRSNRYNRSLIEASLDLLAAIDRNGVITDANAAAELMTGYPRQELIGTDFTRYFTEPDRARVVISQVFQTGEIREFPLAIQHRDQGRTPVVCYASLYRDEFGGPLGIFAAARDTTEQEKAAQQLRDSEELYRSLVMATTQVIWTADPNGDVTGDATLWCEITGQTPEQMQGCGWADALHPDDREPQLAAWLRAVATGNMYDTEYRVRRRDGTYGIFAVRGVPVRGPDQAIRKWVGSCTDLTEQREKEKELRKIAWLLTGPEGSDRFNGHREQPYGDLVPLNTCRLIETAGKEALHGLVHNTMDVLESSAEVCETNGDYAMATFRSGWCRLMDQASRALCGTTDNREALASGKWLCRESCGECSREAIATGQPVDRECQGGIRIYTVPVRRGEEIVGTMGFGYGDPPRDPEKLAGLAERYHVTVEALRQAGSQYESRPNYLVNLAKDRLQTSATLLGVMLEASQATSRTDQLNRDLERRVAERTTELESTNLKVRRDDALIKAINEAQTTFITEANHEDAFDGFLRNIVSLTGSEFGFIDELQYDGDGQPALAVLAIMDLTWDDESRSRYFQYLSGELLLRDVKTIFGAVMTSGQALIANDAAHLSESGAIPSGHPPLKTFLGLPMLAGRELVGVIGIANAPEGYSEQTVSYLQPIVRACANIVSATRSEQRRRQGEEALLEANRRLEQAKEALQTSNQELEAFAYSVSHDLRAPLRAIDGFSHILLGEYREQLTEKPQHFLKLIGDGARQMGRLIDDLLRFSRTNRQSLAVEPVNMAALVRQCLDELAHEREGRHVEIQVGTLPDCPADVSLLKQVWFNLLANAQKFTRARDPARIEVGSQVQNGETVYFVRDNGVGFDMQYAGKLFGVFQRLHAADEYEGTGIGLALVQRIVHRHGGRIWAEARVDAGATFFFTLERSPSGD